MMLSICFDFFKETKESDKVNLETGTERMVTIINGAFNWMVAKAENYKMDLKDKTKLTLPELPGTRNFGKSINEKYDSTKLRSCLKYCSKQSDKKDDKKGMYPCFF